MNTGKWVECHHSSGNICLLEGSYSRVDDVISYMLKNPDLLISLQAVKVVSTSPSVYRITFGSNTSHVFKESCQEILPPESGTLRLLLEVK